jgi:3-deoxy-7-phosphoheptulonate synthase
MLIVMRKGCTDRDTDRVLRRITEMGRTGRALLLGDRRVIGVTGGESVPEPADLAGLEGVDQVLRVQRPYKLASRESRPDRTTVRLGSAVLGSGSPLLIAGPCAVEDEGALHELALRLKAAGAHALRGGAYKPRTSPYSFQGLGPAGLEMLARVRERSGLPVVTEVLDEDSLAGAREFADVLQIGARNMQNYALLRSAGRSGKPVLLKRGMTATLEEWLLAAEYVLSEGNPDVILCERGIRTFADHSRYTLDLAVVPAVREASHLPVLVDPSHGTGHRSRVSSMARAAVAAGADGVLVEVHPDPARALSDGQQALTPEEFEVLAGDLRALASALAARSEVLP